MKSSHLTSIMVILCTVREVFYIIGDIMYMYNCNILIETELELRMCLCTFTVIQVSINSKHNISKGNQQISKERKCPPPQMKTYILSHNTVVYSIVLHNYLNF